MTSTIGPWRQDKRAKKIRELEATLRQVTRSDSTVRRSQAYLEVLEATGGVGPALDQLNADLAQLDLDLAGLDSELGDVLPITEAKIADDAISAPKLAANAVIAGKIAADAVTANTIAAGAVIAGKIGADAVTANTIAAGAISADKIGAGQIVVGSDRTTFAPGYDPSTKATPADVTAAADAAEQAAIDAAAADASAKAAAAQSAATSAAAADAQAKADAAEQAAIDAAAVTAQLKADGAEQAAIDAAAADAATKAATAQAAAEAAAAADAQAKADAAQAAAEATAAADATTKATDAQTAAETAAAAYTDAEVGPVAGQVEAWKFPGTTTINGGMIETDSITADQIDVTTLAGETITGVTISGGTITGSLTRTDADGSPRVEVGLNPAYAATTTASEARFYGSEFSNAPTLRIRANGPSIVDYIVPTTFSSNSFHRFTGGADNCCVSVEGAGPLLAASGLKLGGLSTSRLLRNVDFGEGSFSFNSSGNATIPHSLDATPVLVLVNLNFQFTGNAFNYSATNFQVRIWDPRTNAAPPAAARNVSWVAIR